MIKIGIAKTMNPEDDAVERILEEDAVVEILDDNDEEDGLQGESESIPPPSLSTLLMRLPNMVPALSSCVMVSKKGATVLDRNGEKIAEVERHTMLRTAGPLCDGDGNEIEIEEENRVGVVVDGRLGWIERHNIRQPDDLDELVLRAGAGESWVKLASALRTENFAKMRQALDKAEAQNDAGRTLMSQAEKKLQYHTALSCCDRCDELAKLPEVQKLMNLAIAVGVDKEKLERVDRRGKFLADVAAIFGNPDTIRRGDQEGAMIVDATFLEEALEGASSHDNLEPLRLRKQAADKAAAQDIPPGPLHAIHIETADAKRGIAGAYARRVENYGVQESGDRFVVFETYNGQPIFVHVYFQMRAFVFDGRCSWMLVDDFEAEREGSDPPPKVLLRTGDLADPYAYDDANVRAVRVETVPLLCNVRKLEGNLYYAKKEYEMALRLYTNAIELSTECDKDCDTLKLALFLNRAEARSKLGTLTELRVGLKDLDHAVAFGPKDPRIFLKRAKISALLDDAHNARCHLKTALSLDPTSPQVRSAAAQVKRLIQNNSQDEFRRNFAAKAILQG